MNNELMKIILPQTLQLFTLTDEYDEKYVIAGLLEISKNREEYCYFASEFPYFSPEIPFFFKLVFGESDKLYTCLKKAEHVYRKEVDGDKISIDFLREAVVKSCIHAMRHNSDFKQVWKHEIIKKVINTKLKIRKKGFVISLNNCLNNTLEGFESYVEAPDLFIRQISA